MKATYLIATTVIGLALAAPLAAHHNSPAEPDIGDMMDRHEDAIEALSTNDMGGSMDPSNNVDGSRNNDVEPNTDGIPGQAEPGGLDGGDATGRPDPVTP